MGFINNDGLLYFWQGIKNKLATKVDKETGKGLSTNDYTTAEKDKLAGIAEQANKTVLNNTLTSTSTAEALTAAQGKVLKDAIDGVSESLGELGYGDMMKATYDADGDGVVDKADQANSATNATNADNASKLGGQLPAYYATASSVPTKVSQLENDSAYLTEHQDISGKLDNNGDGKEVTVTFTPASARENVATGEKLSTILGKVSKFFADMKTVAFTGSYADLTNKPTIPTVTNDLTDALKANYDAAYTHSQAAHAPAGAQVNVIEAIQVNGAAQTVTSKTVNISVPTTVAQLTDAGNYALKSDIADVYKYRGSVANASALPTSGQIVGDVYNIEAASDYGGAGMNVAWNGAEWDPLGEIFTITAITNAEIDAILAS